MTGDSSSLSRRGFLRSAAGTTALATASAPAAAQEGEDGGDGGPPDFGNWFSDVSNYDGSVTDARGQDEITVMVGAEGNTGNFAFEPPAIHVDPGTTVVWEWTGEGQSHNVVAETNGDYESDLSAEEGHTFTHTFEDNGVISQYYCDPHLGLGMKGAVVVGDGYPTASEGGGEGGEGTKLLPSSATNLGMAATIGMGATLGFAYFFLKYGGDYVELEE